MKQSGDGSLNSSQQVDEVGHDQQQDDEAARDPRSWAGRFDSWRESVRARPGANRMYRLGVGLIGGTISVAGLALVPLPGPGWVIVFVGLAVLATEFTWAARLEKFARRQVSAWTNWLMRQPIRIRVLVAFATVLLVVAIFYLLFLLAGVPGWIPAAWVPGWTGLT